MTKSMLAGSERCIRYEKLTTADGVQYLCTDGLNDHDYRPNFRVLTKEAAEAWVAERRKIATSMLGSTGVRYGDEPAAG